MAELKQIASSPLDAQPDVNKYLELIELPREIVTEIMSRLPTKSLMWFKSLSKPWCSVVRCLVSDPVFVANHHRRAETRPDFIIYNEPSPLTWPRRKFLTLITDIDIAETTNEEGEIQCVTKHIDVSHIPCRLEVFHCNEIVCNTSYDESSDIYDQTMILYSPIMNKFSTFRSKPVEGYNRDRAVFAMGFGSDSGSTSFKFVRILRSLFTRPTMATAQVYEMGESDDDHLWREIELPFPVQVGKQACRLTIAAVYAKGHCHWLFEDPPSCLCFDVAAESFQSLDLPVEFAAAEYYESNTRLVACEGSLCLVYYPPWKPVEVWAMEKNGSFLWRKWPRRIECPTVGIHDLYCFWKPDKVIIKTDSRDMASYNIGTKAYKKLSPDGYLGWVRYLSPFVNSLASVKQEIADLFRRV